MTPARTESNSLRTFSCLHCENISVSFAIHLPNFATNQGGILSEQSSLYTILLIPQSIVLPVYYIRQRYNEEIQSMILILQFFSSSPTTLPPNFPTTLTHHHLELLPKTLFLAHTPVFLVQHPMRSLPIITQISSVHSVRHFFHYSYN